MQFQTSKSLTTENTSNRKVKTPLSPAKNNLSAPSDDQFAIAKPNKWLIMLGFVPQRNLRYYTTFSFYP